MFKIAIQFNFWMVIQKLDEKLKWKLGIGLPKRNINKTNRGGRIDNRKILNVPNAP